MTDKDQQIAEILATLDRGEALTDEQSAVLRSLHDKPANPGSSRVIRDEHGTIVGVKRRETKVLGFIVLPRS